MIQLRHKTLIVCYGNGRSEPLDIPDLVARVTGESEISLSVLEPWVLEKVIESVIFHFREDLQRDRVPLAEFILLTKSLLESFFKEIIEKNAHLFHLDLFTTAQRCGNGFEL